LQGSSAEVTLKISDLLENFAPQPFTEEKEFCMVAFDRTKVPCHTDKVKYFMTQKEIEAKKNWEVTVTFPNENRTYVNVRAVYESNGPITHYATRQTQYIKGTLMYKGSFRVGSCGALVTVTDAIPGQGCIAGFHIAGRIVEKTGMASIISRETIQTMLDCYDEDFKVKFIIDDTTIVQKNCDVEVTPLDQQMNFGSVPGGFTELYPMDTCLVHPTTTKIRPSRLANLWCQTTTKPTNLRRHIHDNEWRDPYEMALKKFKVNDGKNIESHEWDGPIDSYFKLLQKAEDEVVDKRRFSFEEAVEGIPHTNFGGISRSTSMGFPCIQEPQFRGPGKKHVFGSDDYVYDTSKAEEIRNRVNFINKNADKNIRMPHIFVDTLKDERLPSHKVDAGKARLFNVCPITLLICFRMAFGSFQSWFMTKRLQVGSGIGMNVYSDEWDELARRLLTFSKGDRGVGAGDHSGFDIRLVCSLLWAVFTVINRWYGDTGTKAERIRKILWYEVVNSIHIRDNVVYAWLASLPSGIPVTSLVGTIANQLLFRRCWMDIIGGGEYFSAFSFDQEVFLVCYSDDNLFSVSEDFRERFHEGTIATAMSRLHMEYTNETKTGVNTGLRFLTEVSFLKRKFLWNSRAGRYVAPLDINTVLEIPMWTREIPGMTDQIVEDNVQHAVFELALHGKDVFEKWSPLMVEALREKYGRSTEYTQYELCLDMTSKQHLFMD